MVVGSRNAPTLGNAAVAISVQSTREPALPIGRQKLRWWNLRTSRSGNNSCCKASGKVGDRVLKELSAFTMFGLNLASSPKGMVGWVEMTFRMRH
jgi:hypothetical protein